MIDRYRVLPHRDLTQKVWSEHGHAPEWEHGPCGMWLSESDVKDANWCPHCAATINKAAAQRGADEIAAANARNARSRLAGRLNDAPKKIFTPPGTGRD